MLQLSCYYASIGRVKTQYFKVQSVAVYLIAILSAVSILFFFELSGKSE